MNSLAPITIGIDCRLWNETGVGRYIRNLVWELAKIDTKNNYLLFFKENEFKNVEVPGKNFEKRLANIHWHSVEEQLQLPKILLKEKVDVVHFPYFSVPAFYNKPFVITIHDLIINHFPTGKASTRSSFIYYLKLFAYKLVLFLAIKKARKIISVSESTKKEILEHYKKKSGDIIVTLEGVDNRISNIKQQARSIEEPYFLYVGNGYPHKNLETLVSAFKKFKQVDKKNIKLVFVGREDFFYRRLKQQIKNLDLNNSVLFYEKVSDSGLASLYSNALALVAPSLMEGFGLPVAEAMAHKCLVLASRIDAFKEVCADAAIYFDPKNAAEIADVLQKAAQNKIENVTQLKNKGIERIGLFSWEKMAKETLQVYESSISI